MKPVYLLLSMSLILAPQVMAQENVAADKAQRERDATAAALVRLIGAQLDGDSYPSMYHRLLQPKIEWNTRYEPQTDLILVESKMPTLDTTDIHIDGPQTKVTILGSSLYARLSFQVQPLLTLADYTRFKAENVVVNAQLTQLKANMKDSDFWSDPYSPRVVGENPRLDEYERIEKKLHPLPDYYFRDISLIARFYNNSPLSSIFQRLRGTKLEDSRGWGAEQKPVAESLLKLLTPYEAARN